jgi:hypothetical protein
MHKTLFIFSFFLFLVTSYLFPISALAQGDAWSGNCVSKTDKTVPTIQGFECLFANILSVIVTLAGIAFFIMFIVGGFQYMQTNNDPKAVAAASSTLTYAVIGLVGIIVSWLILSFIKTFTGVNVTEFKIPSI